MKNLSIRVLTVASLCSFLSSTIQAQDTYWNMNSANAAGTNQVYNTKTHELLTIPAGAVQIDNAGTTPRTVFSYDGDVLFCTGPNSIYYNGSVIPGSAGNGQEAGCRALIPLTGVSGCAKRYAVLNVWYSATGTTLGIKVLDVSAGGTPVTVSSTAVTAISGGDIVAAPMQSNGDHYYYYLGAGAMPGQTTSYPYIEQYTLHADGSIPTALNSFGTTANYRKYFDNGTHFVNGLAKISNDGTYIAYQDGNGDMVTFNTATQDFAVGPHIGPVYGLAGVNINGTVKWYVSTTTELGVFVQGSTSYTAAVPGTGIASDIALGADGQVYVGRDGINIYNLDCADLLSFDPYAAGITLVRRAANCVLYNGYKLTFGNLIPGENTSEVSSIRTDFLVNGGRGTIISPKMLYTCSDFILSDLTTPVQSEIHLNIMQVDANDAPVTGGFQYSNAISNTGLNTYNLKNLPGTNGTWLGNPGHDGIYRINLVTLDGCSRISSHTEYVKVVTATASMDFKMIGPSDNNGTPVCPGGIQNRYIYSYYFTPFTQPVTTPPCTQGWLGASTLGITQGAATGTAPTLTPANFPGATTPYEVRVEEFKSDGATPNRTTPILKKNPASIGLAFTFNPKTSPSYYFTNNYETIKNNYVYKTVVSMNSVECGIVRDSSYFKIIDGGLSSDDGGSGYPEQWRMVEVPASEVVNVYPNPTVNNVHFAWNSNAEGKDATISIVDVLGRVIYNQTLAETKGSNDRLVDLSTVASGTYHYTLKTSNGEKTGTVVKQ
ncbi:T9SS type A sorting domain-containing protein [Taibaiella soli]|uniref:Secretion system C-terminal sorting domain-containing protein n=1 Tax=Taibaiella soli TaxID=1649169 RepID=A0A2W2B5Q1_9BACT|nr:T9SS type A sorting domain-containing protein [Taibaiella soli]PZF71529.1 hypothetical protein DN068_17975 [Taibaiella soli]